ncbi:piggyBac transposable element-derived protein 4-like isoform X1 [Onthophagus taurus]|uniref:piggyBac transposable element-derived protein 4-like n=1 Tax=Onthophagus taurus TaxID=166361 RepID=UPI000C203F24|nr:piggyBac transposable element-derived protein 4-like [Onthophagus taurus]
MNERKRPLSQIELERIALAIQNDELEDDEAAESEESETEDFTTNEILEDDEFDAAEPQNTNEESNQCNDVSDNTAASSSSYETENRKAIYAKNGRKWYLKSFHARNARTARKNIVLHLPGPKGCLRNLKCIRKIWNSFFTDEILDIIVQYTNHQINIKRTRYKTAQRYIGETNVVELRALLGLLYLSGVMKSAHLTLHDLFSLELGPPVFRATMCKNRFEFLINCLRFDNKATREERKKQDKFAATREIWDIFEGCCRRNYSPSEYVTIDETLLAFRGRCPFKMYIPSKPDKYGLKLVTMCDSRTFYMCSAKPYIGKEVREGPFSIPTHYVLNLTKEIQGSNRNCTMDNWFSSLEVAEKLLELKLTMVGTLRKNKPDIPKQLVETKGKAVQSSMFVHNDQSTLVSYVPKKNKTVILISTMHTQPDINEHTKKPEMIMFYNETKGGVDTFDQLCHSTTVSRKTRRWPLRIFYGMMDIAGINSYVIYKWNEDADKPVQRSAFLKQLSMSLVEEHLRGRMNNGRLPREIRSNIRQILKCDEEEVLQRAEGPLGRCDYCPRAKNRKARNKCEHCKKSVCAEHRLSICVDCK